MNRTRLRAALADDEGRCARVYTDTVGKVTGGVGRNLTDRGFNESEIELMLSNDIDLVEFELDRAAPWWRRLDDVRQEVLANMCFNLGRTRFLGFKKFLAHTEAGEYGPASIEMLDSKWAAQVGRRAQRLARQMRTGEY